MGLPEVKVTFAQAAQASVARLNNSVVGLILKDTVPATNPAIVSVSSEIPDDISDDNKDYISQALEGFDSSHQTSYVVAYFVAKPAQGTSVDYSDALEYMLTTDIDYIAAPTAEDDGETEELVTWLKENRDKEQLTTAQLVLANTASDYEGVINFTTSDIVVDGKTYKSAQYTPRIAGILATTPLDRASTYCVLPEVESVKRLKRAEQSAAINKGELIIAKINGSFRIARGVNSLQTINKGQTEDWKKIRVVQIMDRIKYDVKQFIQDNYIGQYANNYDNKMLLVAQLKNYLTGMVEQQAIETYAAELSLKKQRAYLREQGTDTTKMTDDEILHAKTGSHVFIHANTSIPDAIEDVDIDFSL